MVALPLLTLPILVITFSSLIRSGGRGIVNLGCAAWRKSLFCVLTTKVGVEVIMGSAIRVLK